MAKGQKKKRFTPKERKFISAMIDGKTQTEAAVIAYNPKDRVSAKAIGWIVMQREGIQRAVDKALTDQGLTIEVAMEELEKLVKSEDYNAKRAGLDMMFKLVNAYAKDRSESKLADAKTNELLSKDEIKKAIDEADAKLQEALKRAIGGITARTKTVDIEEGGTSETVRLSRQSN